MNIRIKILLAVIIAAVAVYSVYCSDGMTDTKKVKEMMRSAVECYLSGDYKGSIDINRKIITMYPNYEHISVVYSMIADAYIAQDDYDGALKALNETEGAELEIDILSALKLEKEERYTEAVKAYRNLRRKYVSDEFTYKWMGDAAKAAEHYMNGSKDKALKIYNDYLENFHGDYIELWAKDGIERCSKGK